MYQRLFVVISSGVDVELCILSHACLSEEEPELWSGEYTGAKRMETNRLSSATASRNWPSANMGSISSSERTTQQKPACILQ